MTSQLELGFGGAKRRCPMCGRPRPAEGPAYCQPSCGRFNGPTLVPGDRKRLGKQGVDIFKAMRVCDRHIAIDEISLLTGHPPASVSAQFRHFRKRRFGGHIVHRQLRSTNPTIYEYHLVPNPRVKEPT